MDNLKLKASDPTPEIDWATANAAPLASTPGENSPELTTTQLSELRPLLDILPAINMGGNYEAENLKRILDKRILIANSPDAIWHDAKDVFAELEADNTKD